MELKPRLIDVESPDRPAGAVLVLHGGASRRGRMMVSPTQLSVLRMIPIARRIARAGGGRLAVFRLLNSIRGWDTHHTPLRDAAWALEQIGERYGTPLPVCVVGHSLGGRAALLTTPLPQVHSSVALAPWVYASDVPEGLSGERILIVHGTKDRIASPERSAALAERLSSRAQVAYISVEGGKHAMLRRHQQFDGLAADFATATLLGQSSTEPRAPREAGAPLIRI
ncbi:MAG: alpha/beta hydrolase [Solirubrobacteraceae bacterium]